MQNVLYNISMATRTNTNLDAYLAVYTQTSKTSTILFCAVCPHVCAHARSYTLSRHNSFSVDVYQQVAPRPYPFPKIGTIRSCILMPKNMKPWLGALLVAPVLSMPATHSYRPQHLISKSIKATLCHVHQRYGFATFYVDESRLVSGE